MEELFRRWATHLALIVEALSALFIAIGALELSSQVQKREYIFWSVVVFLEQS